MDENIYSMTTVIIMNDLSEGKKFSLFIMEDVFDLFSGALVPKDELKDGNIPRVTATAYHNGIAMFTNDIEHKNFRVFENFISISFLGDVFYHKTKTSLDMKIHGIKPKNIKLNMYIAQYLIPLLRNFSSKFTYGNQLSMRLLKKQRIMLPVSDKDQVDWEFMENEGYRLLNSQSLKLREYITKKYNQLTLERTEHSQLSLEDIEWRSFEIRQIASILSGKDIYEAERTEGNMPYITSGSINNGIGYFVGNDNKSKEKEAISVNRNGAVGYAFYHPYEALYGNDTRKVIPNHRNKYSSLFLSHMITMQKEKYGYGLKLGTARLKKQKIMLPVNSNNEPNWKFMESYMKQVEFNYLTKLLDYLD